MDLTTLTQILEIAFEKKVSDIHFEVDYPPMFRARGHLIRSKLAVLSRQDTEFIASTITAQSNRKLPEDLTEFDTSYTLSNVGRFRASIFRQRGNIGIVMRVIPPHVGSFQALTPELQGDVMRDPSSDTARTNRSSDARGNRARSSPPTERRTTSVSLRSQTWPPGVTPEVRTPCAT